ncbi:MAG: hypothetical protein V3R57_10015, partial [Candidatus Bathyarchaeia archaeon]
EMNNYTTWACEIDGAMDAQGLKQIENYLFKGKDKTFLGLGTRHILNYLIYKKIVPHGPSKAYTSFLGVGTTRSDEP